MDQKMYIDGDDIGGLFNNNPLFVRKFILSKIFRYQDILNKTYLSLQTQKDIKIIKQSDVNSCIEELNTINTSINELLEEANNSTIINEDLISKLQEINNSLSIILKQYGSKDIDDILFASFGDDYLNNILKENEDDSEFIEKYIIIQKYITPIKYKIISWSMQNRNNIEKKNNTKAGVLQDIFIAETSKTFDIQNITKLTTNSLLLQLYGVKIVFQNEKKKQTMILTGIVDNIPIEYLNSDYVSNRYNLLDSLVPDDLLFKTEIFDTFKESLSLKDILVNNCDDLYELFIGYTSNIKVIKKQSISKTTREFIHSSLFEQRNLILQLLIHSNNFEIQFIAYILFDILSLDDKSGNNSPDQDLLFDSLPWYLKLKFKNAMKQTIEYTNNIINYDLETNLPLEQRICLMRTTENVKEKAMTKLKELKAKSEDSGSKARQYIDGILKIPFGIYKREPILTIMENNLLLFKKITNNYTFIPKQSTYNNNEILLNVNKIEDYVITENSNNNYDNITTVINNIKKLSKNDVQIIVNYVNQLLIKSNQEYLYIEPANTKKTMVESLHTILLTDSSDNILKELYADVLKIESTYSETKVSVPNEALTIKNNYKLISKYIKDVKSILDDCVHGHDKAKKQIERIVGQWINGEQSGYSFGFEGPPGVGKTSLAKQGLSNCLKDDDGNSRPFSFIAIGGSSNGSTLDGHNYTYVGSMWGKIVDILMETKCMNPIIFIDEVDKVSRTETGREIIGILTHLIDPSQNDGFQDKYFSGVDLDLSKVLFVFSYNDVDAMDRVLLDRIHRIKFDSLTLDEKIVICEKHMLPEIFEKMGQVDTIKFSKEVLHFIIDKYTCEAGVRKLKELLFEIIGEINLELLNYDNTVKIPINVTIDMVKNKFLKDRHSIKQKRIHANSSIGIISGLWANAMGRGGIIQIESQLILGSNPLDMKLTGQQGDVMKESMNVAKSLAWKLTPEKTQKELLKKFEETKTQCIHIHCPEGATPKDGPSAGTAITTVIYSLLNNKKINNEIAITGEINLQGKVTEIGGLDLKILGGIDSGVKTFLFPSENKQDFDKFMENHGHKDIVKGISFYPISTIEEALKFAIE
jgi:ATP-dependent Lon protease